MLNLIHLLWKKPWVIDKIMETKRQIQCITSWRSLRIETSMITCKVYPKHAAFIRNKNKHKNELCNKFGSHSLKSNHINIYAHMMSRLDFQLKYDPWLFFKLSIIGSKSIAISFMKMVAFFETAKYVDDNLSLNFSA